MIAAIRRTVGRRLTCGEEVEEGDVTVLDLYDHVWKYRRKNRTADANTAKFIPNRKYE
jgi:hypothetical protein